MSERPMNMMGMGWLPDYPSFKDYSVEQDEISPRLKRLGQKDSVKAMLKKVGATELAKKLPPSSEEINRRPQSAAGCGI